MIDLIGKRRYGYIISGILVSIGLIFILATLIPNGNIGLQFSIAYTGGTVWEVHFEDDTPDPNDVRAVLEDLGLTGEVAITEANDLEYVLIRTEALSLQAPELAEGSAAAALAAEQEVEAAPSAEPEASAEVAGASVAPAEGTSTLRSASSSVTTGICLRRSSMSARSPFRTWSWRSRIRMLRSASERERVWPAVRPLRRTT